MKPALLLPGILVRCLYPAAAYLNVPSSRKLARQGENMLKPNRAPVILGLSLLLPCASLAGPKVLRPYGSTVIGYGQSQSVSCNGRVFTVGGAMSYTQDETGRDTSIQMSVEAFNPELRGWHEYAGFKVNSLVEWKRTKIINAEGIVYASTLFPKGSCRLRYLDLESNAWIDLSTSPFGRIPDSTYRAVAVGGTIYFFLGAPPYWSGSNGTVVSFHIRQNTWSLPWIWDATRGSYFR